MQGESMTVLQVSNVCDFHILQNIQLSVVIHQMTTKNTLQEKRLRTADAFNIAAQAKEKGYFGFS